MSATVEKIRAEIAKRGVISFARFMELALYCPVCGFYEKENDTIGKQGDFYTSVSVGSLFGELLAFQFADWFAQMERQNVRRETDTLKIVEAGAHDGKLARDILSWLQRQRPQLAERVEYWIIEPSAKRQRWQRETLKEFIPRVCWLESHIKHPALRVNGIIFSNELLDAMPVHRLGWNAQQREWFEWGVAINGEDFVWTRLPRSDHASRFTPQVPSEVLAALPDGFSTEICPATESWWREAANTLESGRLLTIDYGLTTPDFFSPVRSDGTVRAYHRHRQVADVLANPGDQDITAHVNFSRIQMVGEQEGLKTEMFETQARFLTEIASRVWTESGGFGPWTSSHTRQFQTLAHPEHIGRAFRALVQTRLAE